jgi:acyl dehydratase
MIDPSLAGAELASVTFPVERGKLAELARAFHDDDPVWYDPAAAQAAGFAGIPTPPTVMVLADHWRERGALDAAIQLGADLQRLVHGEASFEHLLPIQPGDELTATSRVGDITMRVGKRGGTMSLATLQTDYVNQRRELVATRRDTLIETGA